MKVHKILIGLRKGAVAQVNKHRVMGTNGTADLVINGMSYLLTFVTSTNITTANFITEWGAALEILGISVTTDGSSVIILTAITAGTPFTSSAAITLSGDLHSNYTQTTPNQIGQVVYSEVDLYDPNNLDLSITAAISDANDLTSRKTTNTKTLKLPATPNNQLIFGQPEDFNSVTIINQTARPSVTIEADGTQIFKGYCKINSTTDIASQHITEYEMYCIGDNGDWIGLLNGKFLSQLDYSDQNHYNDVMVMDASETIVAGREYVYDLCDRGEFQGQLYNGMRTVNIINRLPAISMSSFVKRIFNGIGYKISSTFFDSDYFKSKYWMFTNDFLRHPQTFNATLPCKIRLAHYGDQTIDNIVGMYNNSVNGANNMPVEGIMSFNYPVFDYGSSWQRVHPFMYFCQATGKYTFHINTYFTSVSTYDSYAGNYGYAIFTFIKSNRYTGLTAELGSSLPIISTSNTFTGLVDYTSSFDLVFGDEVSVKVQFFGFDPSAAQIILNHDGIFECTSATGVLGMGENQWVDMNANLPDNVLQLTFIQGLKELFNLYFFTDVNSRTVYCEPRDDFYMGKTLDWSNKLDVGRDMKINFTGSNLSKVIRYKYKDDSNDKYVAEWQKQNNQFLGMADEDLTNVFAKDAIAVMENSVFSATWMDTCQRIGLGNAMIPKMWADVALPAFSTKFAPRILTYQGVKTLPSGYWWRENWKGTIDFQNANPTMRIRYDYPSFVSYDDTQVNDDNMMYCDKHYSNGLQQKYFRNAQKTLDEGRQYVAYLNITDLDMENLDFRNIIYIEIEGNGSYFILDKIDNYKSQDEISTLCWFTKIVSQKQIKALGYTTGARPSVSRPALVLSSVRATASGGLEVAGSLPLTRTADGMLQPAGGPIYMHDHLGNLVPVLFIDSAGRAQPVLMASATS